MWQWWNNMNDVKMFLEDILSKAKWDLLPFNFLYDVYEKWLAKNMPNHVQSGRVNFAREVKYCITNARDNETSHKWTVPMYVHVDCNGNPIVDRNGEVWTTNKPRPVLTLNHMDAYEPLIDEYDLKEWKNFDKKVHYRGIIRKSALDALRL